MFPVGLPSTPIRPDPSHAPPEGLAGSAEAWQHSAHVKLWQWTSRPHSKSCRSYRDCKRCVQNCWQQFPELGLPMTSFAAPCGPV